MFQIFTRISRQPHKAKQCILQISRSYCYKPVNRRIASSTLDQILNQKTRRKWDRVAASDSNLNAQHNGQANNGHSLKIIESLPLDATLFGERELIDVFVKLSSEPIGDDALLHDNFNTFTEATRLILPKLSATQNAQIFSQICRAEIPMFDELTEFVAKTLLQRITCLTVDDIIDVETSLRNYYARDWKISKLFETLRQATRTAFIVKMNSERLENQSYEKLMRIIRYLSNNKSLVKNVDTTSLAEQLLSIDDHEFQLNDSVCVIVTLARFPQLNEHDKQLLTKMFRIWCSNATDKTDVRAILELLVSKKLQDIDLTPFQNHAFVQLCAKHAMEHRDIRSTSGVLYGFNEMNYVSTELIDHISKVFDSKRYKRLKIDDYAILCKACELANYKPVNWTSKIVPVLHTVSLQNSNFYKPIDLAVTLNKLGVHHADFIEHLLTSADIQILYKNDDRLDGIYKAYVNECNIKPIKTKKQNTETNAYMSWLYSDLETFVGKNKVLINVPVGDDLTIPLVMKMNTKTGNFIDMHANSDRKNLFCNENELIIGVITQDVCSVKENFESASERINKQRKLIKQKGWVAITLDESLYGSMHTYKRGFTFFKIISYAINNRMRQH